MHANDPGAPGRPGAFFPRLLGDIGGTNARFAWQQERGAPLSGIATYPCADHACLPDAMRHHLQVQGRAAPRWCALGIANPVVGDRVQMTNHHWSFSVEAVRAAFGFERFLVINDFTALALSLPALPTGDLVQVGGGAPVPGAPLALIGAGTGLGVSGLLPGNEKRSSVPLSGEGGHVTLGGATDLEDALIRHLRGRFGHASAERALSGPGLVNLYEASCALAGEKATPRTAAEISAMALAGSDPMCTQAVDVFLSLLGTVAGNLALSLGALGGVYIGGGIAPRLRGRLIQSDFRERFDSKGRFRDYLAAIPVYLIDAERSPALVGASRALDEL